MNLRLSSACFFFVEAFMSSDILKLMHHLMELLVFLVSESIAAQMAMRQRVEKVAVRTGVSD